ncbi:nuclear transport factor 2 family protein [Mycobacterium sp. 663a-19]|uniref:nuclear transport factor 2 family protein n=1 Tax=Mycobacterium sp. 663a-19 TaxID=2986148 RepID=UPI002D1ED0F6|nr:nuclear transport factor 2 family protein [Mycobacterium sp. 663a-19]MEB3980109.1 nuclear transport factor 2 family protein [Mycobacterium sp. 663a-19]
MTRNIIADRTEIVELLSRCFRGVDDRTADQVWVESVFADNARLEYPTGTAHGRKAILEAHRTIIDYFKATHHVTTDAIVDFDGDTAWLRANVTAMHVFSDRNRDAASLEAHFIVGGILDIHAARTDDGWRFTNLTLTVVWRSGAIPLGLHGLTP